MEVTQAVALLQRIMEQPDSQRRPPILVVEVFSPGSIGGTPCVTVEHLQAGFDWDHGKVLLRTQQPVTALTPEQVADIQTSARQGQSWHAYQAHKAMQEKLRTAQDEHSELSRQATARISELTETLGKARVQMLAQQNLIDRMHERLRKAQIFGFDKEIAELNPPARSCGGCTNACQLDKDSPEVQA